MPLIDALNMGQVPASRLVFVVQLKRFDKLASAVFFPDFLIFHIRCVREGRTR